MNSNLKRKKGICAKQARIDYFESYVTFEHKIREIHSIIFKKPHSAKDKMIIDNIIKERNIKTLKRKKYNLSLHNTIKELKNVKGSNYSIMTILKSDTWNINVNINVILRHKNIRNKLAHTKWIININKNILNDLDNINNFNVELTKIKNSIKTIKRNKPM